LISPPNTEAELLERAESLCGLTAGNLARRLGVHLPSDSTRAKGKVGELVERALGASAGNQDQPDFPALGVELKTIPMDALGRVRESTFVCAIDLDTVEQEEWEDSRVLRKLRRVLWIPVAAAPGADPASRRLGKAQIWSPTTEQEEILRGDWLLLMGEIAVGGGEQVSAHLGQALQVRPKAANATVRVELTTSRGITTTRPCGFYLRARFTAALLWDLSQ